MGKIWSAAVVRGEAGFNFGSTGIDAHSGESSDNILPDDGRLFSLSDGRSVDTASLERNFTNIEHSAWSGKTHVIRAIRVIRIHIVFTSRLEAVRDGRDAVLSNIIFSDKFSGFDLRSDFAKEGIPDIIFDSDARISDAFAERFFSQQRVICCGRVLNSSD